MRYSSEILVGATTCLGFASAFSSRDLRHGASNPVQFHKRQLPAQPSGVQSLVTPNGVNITYKDPGAEGVCETTPGVKSYAGFVNLAPDVHSFVSALNHSFLGPIDHWLTEMIVLVLRKPKRPGQRPSNPLA